MTDNRLTPNNPDDLRVLLRYIIAAWDEFGPEHGFEEAIERARRAVESSGPVICPDCKGERRGSDGALCKRCGGNAQIGA